jgi:hypothetical protein
MQKLNFQTTFQIDPTLLSVETVDIDFSTIFPKLKEVGVNILNASMGDGLKNFASIFTGNLDRPEEQLQALIYTAFSNAMFKITVSRFKTDWDKQNRTRDGQILDQDIYHPNLVHKIVEIFNSTTANPNNAQLIFNTHDTNLLSCGLFRRDQIWFVEKNRYGSADLFSLSSFKTDTVRKMIILKKYISLVVMVQFRI